MPSLSYINKIPICFKPFLPWQQTRYTARGQCFITAVLHFPEWSLNPRCWRQTAPLAQWWLITGSDSAVVRHPKLSSPAHLAKVWAYRGHQLGNIFHVSWVQIGPIFPPGGGHVWEVWEKLSNYHVPALWCSCPSVKACLHIWPSFSYSCPFPLCCHA